MADLTNSSWSEADSSNTQPAPSGFPSGILPSQVGGVVRALMGATKRSFDRSNAMIVSTGSANAYVLTYSQTPEAYVKGEVYRFFANATNTGAATININGLGSRSILRADGTALSAGEIVAAQVVTVICDGANFLHQSVGSRFFKDSVSIIKDGDAILTLEDTGAAATTFRSKNIYSSRNVNGGNDWLFRSRRPSDGAIEDFTLKTGTGGTIWTTGNFNPDLKASLGANVSFNRVTVAENGTGNALQIGNDVAMGDIDVANTISVRGLQDSNQAYFKMGSSTRIGFDSANWIVGGGGNLYIQPSAGGSYPVWHSGNFNPDTKASLSAQVRFAGVLPGASGEAYIYSDPATNNIRLRSGSSAAYKYAGLNDDGTFQIFSGGVDSAGDVRATGNLRTNGRVIVGEGQTQSYIEMRDTDEGTRYLHNNSGTIGFLGNDGGWKMRVYDSGALWTAQLGDLNSRIETRAADFANDRASYRVAKTGDTMTGDLRISKTYPGISLFWGGVIHGQWMVDSDGSMVNRNGDNGYVYHRLSTSGAMSSASGWSIGADGNLYMPWAGDYLSNQLGNKLTKQGGTLTGDLQIQKAEAQLQLHYPNVRIWYTRSAGDGNYRVSSNDGGERFMVGSDGSLWCAQLGDINNRIENRAQAWANTRQANLGFTPVRQSGGAYQQGNTVYLGWDGSALRAQVDGSDLERIVTRSWLNPINDIRMAFAGNLNSDWNRDVGNFAEPYGGAAITTLNFYNTGQIGDHVGGARWRYIQKQDSYGNWYTVGYA